MVFPFPILALFYLQGVALLAGFLVFPMTGQYVEYGGFCLGWKTGAGRRKRSLVL